MAFMFLPASALKTRYKSSISSSFMQAIPLTQRFVWVLLLGFALSWGAAAPSHAQGSNLSVAQGGSATIPATGTQAATGSDTWDIYNSSGTLVAHYPPITIGGWSISYISGSSSFSIHAPSNATVGTGYLLCYGSSGGAHSVNFDVVPSGGAQLYSLTLSQYTTDGSPPAPTGTVTLTAKQSTDVTVNLVSSNTAAATVPSTVTVTAGNTTATFTVTPVPVSATATTNITASITGSSITKTVTLTVTPPVLTNFTISSQYVNGGATVNGIVYIDTPAPSGGINVNITSSDPNNIEFDQIMKTMSETVTIPGGATQSAPFPIYTGTVNFPETVTLTATWNGTSLTVNLTLNPPYLHVTRIMMSPSPSLTSVHGNGPVIELNWSGVSTTSGYYALTRDNNDGNGPANTIYSGSNTTYDDLLNFTPGNTYLYTLYAADMNGNILNPNSPLSIEQLIPYRSDQNNLNNSYSDNQTVDGRQDPRYSTTHYVNFNFGPSVYNGGLFVGNATDPATVGRSFLKFGMPSSGSAFFRTGTVNVYNSTVYQNSQNGTTPPITVIGKGWHDTATSWSSSILTWTNQPTPPSTAVQDTFTIPSPGSNTILPSAVPWCNWSLSAAIKAALSIAPPIMSVLLQSQTESSYGWAYFAKKEYSGGLFAPVVMYAYDCPTVIQVTAPSPIDNAFNGESFWATVIINGLGDGDNAVVNLSLSGPISLSSTQIQQSGTVTISSLNTLIPIYIAGLDQQSAYAKITASYSIGTSLPQSVTIFINKN